jgi:hypothetical protein
MLVVKKARGSEMIPNISFWKSLPGYIKVGKSTNYYPVVLEPDIEGNVDLWALLCIIGNAAWESAFYAFLMDLISIELAHYITT